jgi:hypothetical protein
VREALDENCFVVLDESHNVAQATSNAADNISCGMARVQFVMFSSGTWAKNARNLEIYRPILPLGVSHEEMSRLITRGGIVMQETFVNMLARDGMFIARQHDLSSCQFEVVEMFLPRSLGCRMRLMIGSDVTMQRSGRC